MSNSNQNDDAIRELEGEEGELLKLEQELEQIAQEVIEYRTTFTDKLKSTLDSVLASQISDFQTKFTVPEVDGSVLSDEVAKGGGDNLTKEDAQQAEKVRLLKEKISNNASALPLVLNRVKECTARIYKLKSSDSGTIHPVFKRRRAH